MTKKKRIGILGGTFDPIHSGHLAIADLVLQSCKLDSILFIPAGSPPHKQNSVNATAKQRLDMLTLAIKPYPSFSISEEEIMRKGPSYTIDTLNHLLSDLTLEYHFIIGSDNLLEICTWHNYKDIIKMLPFIVVARPEYSTIIPKELRNGLFTEALSPMWGLSSSMIRAYLKNNVDCRTLIPNNVREYIHAKKIYLCNSSNH